LNRLKSLIRLIINNRKAQIITISSAAAILLILCIIGVVVAQGKEHESSPANSPDVISDSDSDFAYVSPTLEEQITSTPVPEPVIDEEVTSFVPATEMDLDPTSITVFVNKEFALPKDYKPDDLVTPNIRFDILTYDERTLLRSEAAKAIERLFAAAEKEGLYLYGVSGYRSFARQWKIFTNNIATQGKAHTLQYSAVPGTSEHQTGLSMDVSAKSIHYKLDEEFADTPEGKWLAENAYKYGFTIRYPKDKVDITGYAYEPWHIRYVGRGLSYYLHDHELTLEEYYNYTPDPNFDFEAQYADIINYVPPTLTPSVTPTNIPVTGEAVEPTVTDTPPDDNENTDGGEDTEEPGTDLSATPVPSPTMPPTVTGAPSEGGTDTTGEDTEDGPGTTGGALDILYE
jgi:D-alanyl-D-alanine carboxypeptidase